VAELGRPVPQHDLPGMPIFSSSPFERSDVARAAAGWVWNSRSISAEDTNPRGKALVEFSARPGTV